MALGGSVTNRVLGFMGNPESVQPTRRVGKTGPDAPRGGASGQDPYPVAEQTRNAKNVTLRMYEDEHQAMVDACEALSNDEVRVEPSQLLATAAMEECWRLGFSVSRGSAGARRERPGWEYAAPLREEKLERRITITVHPLYYHVIRETAEAVEEEVPRFMVGCMWRFIANRQRAEPRNARLKAIAVPRKYRGG
jgi:hypothetical protein